MATRYETTQQLRSALDAALLRLKEKYPAETELPPQFVEELAEAMFESDNGNANPSQAHSHYRYLEPKPYKRTKQLGIKGRNMIVWNLVATMRTEGFTIEEAADGYGLPPEAVIEALDYYYKNKAMIEEENEQIGRELGLIKH